MSLSMALNVANSSLQTSGVQTATTSRNIAAGREASYSRKSTTVITGIGGTVQVVSIQRATDAALYKTMLKATSAAATQDALLDGLTKMSQTIGDPELDQSPAAKLGDLNNKLQQYAANPSNTILAQAVQSSATTLANTLNQATTTVQATRALADADMASSVQRINDLLAKIDSLNTSIVHGTVTGADVTDNLDSRDNLISQLSEEIGISVVARDNNDVAIYTDGGVALFETHPREVTFQATNVFNASTIGNAVYVDGVAVVGGPSSMPSTTGRLAGLATLRDDVGVTYQSQLDEIARGLIEVFAESDPASVGPDVPGLFTWPAGTIPASATIETGLAGLIMVNPAIDPTTGGNLDLIRDGITYDYNTTDEAGFTERLNTMVTEFGEARVFDPDSGADPTNTLSDYAASSASWLEFNRQQVDTSATYQSTMLQRASEALSNTTGVNLDDELSKQLEIERTFAASAKLIAAVDQMLQDLLNAV
ncbi:flagellar hook-associated protein FlgK [Pleomorphomonas sp. NRK KF1]|uniref:flagellar hook-associated protein FlgK n=1 Tax=Pleomorphomonas sp. NRK KF1 TaxID=2943000 RepID=UPI0020444ACD|nr:flagellar hook-associated protein FlgK [Pleomorphomonas sp. NRK KF1]MCM5552034.1 flagellar hook-associated protein FlgK [Pleomorphomonas sp. NRK KF1]